MVQKDTYSQKALVEGLKNPSYDGRTQSPSSMLHASPLPRCEEFEFGLAEKRDRLNGDTVSVMQETI